MKSTVRCKGEEILENDREYSISFGRALQLCCEHRVISGPEKRSIDALDAHRDQAANYLVDMSEQLLYVVIQAAVTSFDGILNRVFSERINKLQV